MTERTSGEIIRYYRQRRNMTREELAGQLNIGPEKLAHWEENVTVPRPGAIARLVQILEIPAEEEEILQNAFQAAKAQQRQAETARQAVQAAQDAEAVRLAHREKAIHLLWMGVGGFAAGVLFFIATGSYKDMPWYGAILIGLAVSGIPFGWMQVAARPRPYSPLRYYTLLDIFLKLLFLLARFACAYLIGLLVFPVLLCYHGYKGSSKGSLGQKVMLLCLILAAVFTLVFGGGMLITAIRK